MMDIESIAPAAATDQLFTERPRPSSGRIPGLHVAQDANSGVNAFFGAWPGEESDEELQAALRALG
jgi:hypothetical protein